MIWESLENVPVAERRQGRPPPVFLNFPSLLSEEPLTQRISNANYLPRTSPYTHTHTRLMRTRGGEVACEEEGRMFVFEFYLSL